jgi:uncharacterized protein (DUF885 family)
LAADSLLHKLFAADWEWQMQQFPTYATRLGDSRYDDRLADMSFTAIKNRQLHQHELLQQLNDIDFRTLTIENKLSFDLFKQKVDEEIESEKYPTYLMPIDQMGGPQISFPSLHLFVNFNSLDAYHKHVKRLAAIPQYLDQITVLMRKGIKEGWMPPKMPVRLVANQIKAAANGDLYFKPFLSMPDSMSQAESKKLLALANTVIYEQVKPAFEKLHNFWTEEYYPACTDDVGAWVLPADEDYYAFQVRSYTTTQLTPEEIHAIGLNEVTRIRAEMEKVIRQSGFKGNFAEFTEFLRTDNQFYYTSADDLLAGYRQICKRIDAQLPKLFNTLPKIPYDIRPIPDHEAPASTTAYYQPPAADGSRGGSYFANTYRLETRPIWEMESLSIHESVPGHHLQISLAIEQNDLPAFRRFSHFTAFVEGWGLYAESLGEEMGFYTSPYSKFGQLTYEMWRAVRLVVDTGIHHKRWSRQQAIDFFTDNTAKTPHDIAVEVDRYIVWPGQALAYKMGELTLKALRAKAETALGERFSIGLFHDAVLLNGAVPLNILEMQIDAYIANTLAI